LGGSCLLVGVWSEASSASSLVDESSRVKACNIHHHNSITTEPSSSSSSYLLLLLFRSEIIQHIEMTITAMTEERAFTAEEMAEIRTNAKVILQELKEHETLKSSADIQNNNNIPSWIRPDSDKQWLAQRSDRCRYFDNHGFLLETNFVDSSTVQKLKDQMKHLAETQWDPQKVASFGTGTEANQARGDYFLDSSNRVHYFAEPHALVEGGGGDQLRQEFQNDKLAALNKAGHAMHIIPGAFRDYTLSSNVLDLVTDLGWIDPVVPQSMYIFKQPKIGGTVHSHQDSSFLHTTPRQTCLGLWLALDDATLENGCLWVRPGSHREPLRRQFIRNSDYFEKNDKTASKLIFDNHHDNPQVTWEGSLPKQQSLLRAGFVPIECKAGDLVTFCGTLDHLSLPNFSELFRHTFQLHLVEGPKEGVTWSPKNWLQYPPGEPFINLKTMQ
jgi:phytanoyl-CoA hydroxylase